MNLLINEQDQKFTLYEMLGADGWFNGLAREELDRALAAAKDLAVSEVYPTLKSADQEGCRLEGGDVVIPRSFHRLKQIFDEGGWNSLGLSKESGGEGFPFLAWSAVGEWFQHNGSFLAYTNRAMGAANLIELSGDERQKKLYLPGLVSGAWGGPVSVTEADAGSDIMNIETRALKQSDGSFRLQGTKTMISNGDADIYSNMIYVVLARIDGAPPGFAGLSLFLVPKYRLNEDGSPGTRNDYQIQSLENKMGLNGWAVTTTSFGDRSDCYAELLGEENQGLVAFMSIMQPSQIALAMWSLGVASAAGLHALNYARDRKQGADISDPFNPLAPRQPLIRHPDVRRMLIWMKSHVDGIRTLTYYCALLIDKKNNANTEEDQIKYQSLSDILVPVCRVFASEAAFRVSEQAMQVYGGSGYYKDNPIEQLMRDIKPASIVEGTNGIQAVQLLAMGMGENGNNFIHLLGEMGQTLEGFQNDDRINDLFESVQSRISLLGDVGLFFSQCGAEGNLLVPVTGAFPFIRLVGIVCTGWMLLWQAGTANEKLQKMISENGVDQNNRNDLDVFLEENRNAAYYDGKIQSAKFYINHCLPEADGLSAGIKSADLSMMDIRDSAF